MLFVTAMVVRDGSFLNRVECGNLVNVVWINI